uniref:Kazal-like domain-containing protein n=1 Tax=Anabas testudineus TaxID=64144 RepID=A0A3Q1K3C4_ANATE
MRVCLVFLCLLAATFALSVKSKPHGKHHGLRKTLHTVKEKDIIPEVTNRPQISPTPVTREASTQVQEDEELSSEGNVNTNKEDGELDVTDGRDKSTVVLLSEEELVDLLKKEAEEEEELEERELEEEEDRENKGEVESGEAVGSKEKAGVEEGKKDDEEVTDEEVEEESVEDDVQEEVEMMPQKDHKEEFADKVEDKEDGMETGSTESEIPANPDYAPDSGVLQPLPSVSAQVKSHTDVTQHLSKAEREKETSEKELLIIADDYEQDVQNTEAVDNPQDGSMDPQEPKGNTELDSGSRAAEKEEEKRKNDSESQTKGKMKKQKKNQRARNHSPQREETQSGQEQNQQEPPESESSSTDNTVHKAKRRREGKWGPLVGMNPVQIRATVDLYPSSRPSLGESAHHPETPADPCDSFHCKRGKMCKLDANNKPGCVCQEPSKCPHSVNEFDHVCGTDNRTYDTSCELFATKCNLEGTKKGHRLHLDYTGPCKFIPPCVDAELVQFPLRMRDWLKNVLLQLYEFTTPGFLTPKQRFRVKKIFESERRLHAGDHSVELLAQDFEKNYNMYIYPVHWQFAQLDQHPSDRLLSHSELAPLRVPLVPMEHCTSRFFQECDADKDKQVSFKEWTSCFGIKSEDMDVSLLF